MKHALRFMIGREDIGLKAALPRVASHAPLLEFELALLTFGWSLAKFGRNP
jgi:hypothetical protein